MLVDGEGEYYSDISDPPIIGFNDFNGIFVDENSTLSGFIVSSVLPDSTEWYVSELLISGELSAITQPLELYVEEIFQVKMMDFLGGPGTFPTSWMVSLMEPVVLMSVPVT